MFIEPVNLSWYIMLRKTGSTINPESFAFLFLLCQSI